MTDAKAVDLLPCPFCGSVDIRHWDAVYFETFCQDCGAHIRPIHKSDDYDADHAESVTNWNKRAGSTADARGITPELAARILEAGFVSPTQDGGSVCHYCGVDYCYDAHEADCAYVALEAALLARDAAPPK